MRCGAEVSHGRDGSSLGRAMRARLWLVGWCQMVQSHVWWLNCQRWMAGLCPLYHQPDRCIASARVAQPAPAAHRMHRTGGATACQLCRRPSRYGGWLAQLAGEPPTVVPAHHIQLVADDGRALLVAGHWLLAALRHLTRAPLPHPRVEVCRQGGGGDRRWRSLVGLYFHRITSCFLRGCLLLLRCVRCCVGLFLLALGPTQLVPVLLWWHAGRAWW
jgi:hypothetical protein